MPATPVQGLRPAPDPPAAHGLVALADRCVQCGLCLPHCPTYLLDRSEAESPRGRIAYVKALADGRLAPSAAGDTHLDHCLGCRRCEPVCPAGVSYGELLIGARTAQAQRQPPPRRLRWAAALLARPALLGVLLDLYRRLGGLLPRAARPPVPRPAAPVALPAPVLTAPTLALFSGCVADRYESGSRAALARLLARAGLQVVQPVGQTCCGAAAAHAGDAATATRLATINRAAFAGQERVLCLASGCHDSLARSLAAGPAVEDALLALDRVADRLVFRPARARVALHLPCTQRSVTRSEGAVRRLLARVPALDLIELPDTGCCGAAGLHQLAEPARAAALRQPLIDALAASGATGLISANIGCRLHLAGGTTIPVRHPIDFLAEHLA